MLIFFIINAFIIDLYIISKLLYNKYIFKILYKSYITNFFNLLNAVKIIKFVFIDTLCELNSDNFSTKKFWGIADRITGSNYTPCWK